MISLNSRSRPILLLYSPQLFNPLSRVIPFQLKHLFTFNILQKYIPSSANEINSSNDIHIINLFKLHNQSLNKSLALITYECHE